MGLTDTGDLAERALASLVSLAASGDDVAFTRVVAAFHADMAKVAYVVCGGDRDLADDAVQSAWTIAWSRLRTLRDPCRVRAWLLSVTANEARQLLRHRRRAVTVGLEFAEERVGAPDATGSVTSADVAGILARCTPDERTLIALRYAAGYDSAEIGTLLGISPSGVRSRLERLLERIRNDTNDVVDSAPVRQEWPGRVKAFSEHPSHAGARAGTVLATIVCLAFLVACGGAAHSATPSGAVSRQATSPPTRTTASPPNADLPSAASLLSPTPATAGTLPSPAAILPASPTPVPAPIPPATPAPSPISSARPTSSAATLPTPTAAPVPLHSQPPAPASLDLYTVVAGDTLWEIAAQRGISLGMLVAANPQIADPGLIHPGELVRVPVLLDLGTLGGATARGFGINENGEIVGTSDLSSVNLYHAFQWQYGAMTDLGTLGGARSQAVDVNDRGQIVGTATASPDENAPWRAVLWQDGIPVDLGSLGGTTSMAHAVNNLGQVVGTTTIPNGNGRGFIWQDGVMRDLGTLGGAVATVPIAINDRGQVVGAASTAGGGQHAFLWQAGSMADLGTLGGAWSEAQDINDGGQVVGVSPVVDDSYESWHAFLWEDGVMRDLGTLGGTWSQALAINGRGQVVGSSTTADGVKHPFLWQDGVMTDLGMLQGCRDEGAATDINERGEIVGTCLLQFGEHAFLNLAHMQLLPRSTSS